MKTQSLLRKLLVASAILAMVLIYSTMTAARPDDGQTCRKTLFLNRGGFPGGNPLLDRRQEVFIQRHLIMGNRFTLLCGH